MIIAALLFQVRSNDSGVYACVATNTFGEVISKNAKLDVASKLLFLMISSGFQS